MEEQARGLATGPAWSWTTHWTGSRPGSRPLDHPLDQGAAMPVRQRMASGDLGTLDGAMSLERRRVLIIDGHLAVGRGLKALVEEMPGLRVVGLCTRGERGLAQAAMTTPDIALVDADLPGLCSAAVIRLLRWRLPRTRVVALGTYPERQRAGARGRRARVRVEGCRLRRPALGDHPWSRRHG